MNYKNKIMKGGEERGEKLLNSHQDYKYTYVEKAGDNPWVIAQKHKMNVEELVKLNQLSAEKAKQLKVGDKLKVKG
jgi:LysM repeat protein